MVNGEKIVDGYSFLVGAAVGGALGAIAGVLFAPQRGVQTREQIADWIKERRDEGSDILARVKEQGQHKTEQLSAALKAGRRAFADASGND
jgi:gas vesicle protein